MDSPTVSSIGHEPWDAPWWKPLCGDWVTLVYIVSIHVLGVVGLAAFPSPGWRILLVMFMLLFVGGLGVTVGYHRELAHHALRLHPIARHVLIFCAMFTGSGAPASWTASHRQHHAYAETPEDISSPSTGGFWWAHLRWLWQARKAPTERWCPDLEKPEYRFWHDAQLSVIALSMFCGLPFGPVAFFWLGPVRLVYSLHAQCFSNSIAHMRPDRKEGEDSSRNLVWLGAMQLLQGENWHHNHHAQPGAARLGLRPWQIDVGWYTIMLLERLGLATKIRRPTVLP